MYYPCSENKGADQLRSYCTADQRLCFHYMVSTVPPLLIPKISRFYFSSLGLCQTGSEILKTVFLVSRRTCNEVVLFIQKPLFYFIFFAAKLGWKCLLLEKKKFPRDKYCGDAVCKTAIEILMEMGIYEQLIKEKKAHVVNLNYSHTTHTGPPPIGA